MELELKPSRNDEKLIENILGFTGKILIGVPEDTNRYLQTSGNTKEQIENRANSNINNAQLLAILENGSPIKNLPPRRVIEPVIRKHEEQIREVFNKVYQLLIEGRREEADKELNALSLAVQAWCQAFFREDNGWEPDKPATIHAKNRRAGKPKDAPTTTLIDTGSLRGAIRGIYVKGRR